MEHHQEHYQSGEGANNSESGNSVQDTIPNATVYEYGEASMPSVSGTIRSVAVNHGRWQSRPHNRTRSYYQYRPPFQPGPHGFHQSSNATCNPAVPQNHFSCCVYPVAHPTYPISNTIAPDCNTVTASASYSDTYRPFTSNDGHYNVKAKKGPGFKQLPNGYEVLAWSISGIETNVLIRRGNRLYAFDLGYAHRQAVDAEYVFISHGHVDHIHGIVHHASKRNLYRKPPATYYVPAHLVDHVREIARQFAIMQFKSDLHTSQDKATESDESATASEQQDNSSSIAVAENLQTEPTMVDHYALTEEMKSFSDLKIVGVENGKEITLRNGDKVLPFATCHRVPSSGYLIYERVTDRYTKERSYKPSIAYTGDTTFEVFLNPPTEDLLRVRVLVSECTYIGESAKLQPKAEQYKHVHFDSFIEHAALFEQVQQIVLVHFSDRHHPNEIKRLVDDLSPASLRNKVFCATMAQDCGL